MNAARIESEQIAAFLERRLSNAERTIVIAHLAESPESYQLFIDAVMSKVDSGIGKLDLAEVADDLATVIPISGG